MNPEKPVPFVSAPALAAAKSTAGRDGVYFNENPDHAPTHTQRLDLRHKPGSILQDDAPEGYKGFHF